MIADILHNAFDVVFAHLGREVTYQPLKGAQFNAVAIIKTPENQYDLGDSQVIDQVAEVTLNADDLTPKIGEYICSNGRKYRIYTEPILDASNNVWKFFAVSIGE